MGVRKYYKPGFSPPPPEPLFKRLLAHHWAGQLVRVWEGEAVFLEDRSNSWLGTWASETAGPHCGGDRVFPACLPSIMESRWLPLLTVGVLPGAFKGRTSSERGSLVPGAGVWTLSLEERVVDSGDCMRFLSSWGISSRRGIFPNRKGLPYCSVSDLSMGSSCVWCVRERRDWGCIRQWREGGVIQQNLPHS